MRHLVVTADDFGLTRGHNRGILRACREGIVRSVSVLPNTELFEESVRLLRGESRISVGVHLALVDGRTVSDPARVPTLVLGNGRLPADWSTFLIRWAMNRVDPGDVDREFEAQTTRLLEAGIRVTHLDTHQHLGALPPIAAAAGRVAARHGIPFVRLVREPFALESGGRLRRAQGCLLTALSLLARPCLPGGVRSLPALLGFTTTGRLTVRMIRCAAERMGPCAELVCHPAEMSEDLEAIRRTEVWARTYRFERELEALCVPGLEAELRNRGVAVVGHRDLPGPGGGR